MFSTVLTAILALSVAGITSADVYPGDTAFQSICQEIINNVAANSVTFWNLVTVCNPPWGCYGTLQERETLTRVNLCARLVQHNSYSNEAFLGGAEVTVGECMGAFNAPVSYGVAEWNMWTGRHCGVWRNVNSNGGVSLPFTDNSLRNAAGPSSSPGVYRQDLSLLNRPSCCNTAWTESGGAVSILSLFQKEQIHLSKLEFIFLTD